MIAFGPIVILLLCGLAAWMGIAAVLRVCRVPRGVETGGSCGRCGYAYTEWTRCPECGAKVAEVGVATPWLMLRRRGGMPGALFALTMMAIAMVFLLTGVTMGLCQAVGWMQHVRQSGMSPIQRVPGSASENPGLPDPGQAVSATPGVSFLIHRDVVGPSVNAPSGGEVLIVLMPGGSIAMSADRPDTTGMAHVVMDVRSRAFSARTAAGEVSGQGKGIEVDDVASWMEHAGAPFDEEERRIAAAQILMEIDPGHAGAIKAIGPGRLGPRGVVLANQGFATRSVPSLPFPVIGATGPGVVMALAAAASAVMYVLALVWVLRRRRRLMAMEGAGASGGVESRAIDTDA